MKKLAVILWLLPALSLLLLSAAGARTINTTEELLELCGTVIEEDVTIEPGVYDLSEETWVPIAEVAQGCGIYGEAGVVLRGFHFGNTAPGFVTLNNGTVMGLTFRMEMFINTGSDAGVVAAQNGTNGTIDSCTVYGEGEWTVGVGESRKGKYLGGIAGINDGAVTNCTVHNLTLSGGNNTTIGGIAGKTTGTIYGCTVHNTAVTGTNDTAVIGGVTGLLEGPEAEVPGFAEECSVLYSSVSGKAAAMGGIAGKVLNGSIGTARVNFTDLCHTEGGKCALGGIAGIVDGGEGSNRLENSYYADKAEQGMTWLDEDAAGGIVGSYFELNNAEVFYKCYYCTDFCDAGLYGENTGQDTPHHWTSCSGETKAAMTADGWAGENLEGGWKNAGPEGYPVITDLIPVYVSRFYRGEDYLPLSFYRLLYDGQDVANLGLVDADTEFDPEGFTLEKATDEFDAPIVLDYVTLNGAMLTEPAKAGDFGELCFSAAVDNEFCRDVLQPAVDRANEIYNNGRGVYSPDSLIALKYFIDDAQQALDDAYLSVDEEWGQTLVDAINYMELDYFVYTVSLESDNATVSYLKDKEWIESDRFDGAMGELFVLKAEANDDAVFLYWQDAAGNVLSEDAQFEYTVNRTTTLTAVTAPKESHTFTYKDSYGKIYKTDTVTDYSEVAYPAEAGQTGLRTGYRVKEWQNDFPGSLPASGEVQQDVTFTAILERADTAFTVTTYALLGSETYLEETVTLKSAQVYTRTAPEALDDVAFTCWKDAASQKIVSYSPALSLSVYSDLTLEAVYEGAAESVTCANLWEPATSGNKISFTGQIENGDDFAGEVMHGVLLLKSDEPVDEILFDTPGVIVGKSSGYSALTRTFIINKKNVESGDTWYGRAFIIYNGTAGERKVAFSEVKSATMP